MIKTATHRNAQSIGASQLRQFSEFLEKHDRLMADTLAGPVIVQNAEHYHIDSSKYCPISLDYNLPDERISLFGLATSDDKLLNKLIVTFGQLCVEVDTLKQEAEPLQLNFLYYDDFYEQNPSTVSQTVLVQISEVLEVLYEIHNLVERCSVVAVEIFRQLNSYFATNKTFNSYFFVGTLMSALANLAFIVQTFNRILSKSYIQQYWPQFMKTIDSVDYDQDHSEDDFTALRSVVCELEHLFDDGLFRSFLSSLYNIKINLNTTSDTTITSLFNIYIDEQYLKISKLDKSEVPDVRLSMEIIKFNIICIIKHNLFTVFNQKLLKQLYDLNLKYFGITLIENILWCPEEFVQAYATTKENNHQTFVNAAGKVRRQFFENVLKCKLKHEVDLINIAVRCMWKIEVIKAEQAEDSEKNLSRACDLILKLIHTMGQIRYAATSILNLHIHLGEKIFQCTVMYVFRLVENLKTIQNFINAHSEYIINVSHKISQHLAYQALCIVREAIETFTSKSKTYYAQNIDTLTALQIAERCLYGAATKQRLLVAKLALANTDSFNFRLFSMEMIRSLMGVFDKLETFIDLKRNVDRLADTTFMYWHQTILEGFVNAVVNIHGVLDKTLSYAKESRECGCDFWKSYKIAPSPAGALRFLAAINSNDYQQNVNFKFDNSALIRSTIVRQTALNVEHNLRLYTHNVSSKDEIKKREHYNELRQSLLDLLDVSNIQLNDHHMSVRSHIEFYLSSTFYKLKAVAPSDGQAYSDMRCWAKEKFNLEIVNDYLPTQTLDQGLDLVYIMRNMDELAVNYSYDMLSQEFTNIHKAQEILTTKHIFNSLRTHGMGVVSVAAQYGYQYFIEIMEDVLQYFYQRNIKSRLQKDLKVLAANGKYSFKMASDLLEDIQNMEKSLELKNMYAIITKIGNIMGYIRTIKSAVKKHIATSRNFVPVDNDQISFEEMCKENGLPDFIRESAKNLDDAKKIPQDEITYFDNYLKYFHSLQKDVYTTRLYIILPSLTVYYVEKCEKDEINDGFVMGMAYFLINMSQIDKFFALEWFETVDAHYAAECAQLRKQMKEPDENKLRQILLRKEQRFKLYQNKYDMLHCNVRSAITLLKSQTRADAKE